MSEPNHDPRTELQIALDIGRSGVCGGEYSGIRQSQPRGKNLPAAEEALCQSLSVYRQTGNRPGIAAALDALSSLLRSEGRSTESDQLAAEAAELKRAMLTDLPQQHS